MEVRLLLNLELIEKIAREAVKASKVPVTAKIRKGWDSENIVAVEVAKILKMLEYRQLQYMEELEKNFIQDRQIGI